MKQILILICFLFSGIILLGQKKNLEDILVEKSKKIETSVTGYLFGPRVTNLYMSASKKNKYLNYWYLNDCTIEQIEVQIDAKISKEYSTFVQQNKQKYVRQYFPFINKRGEQVMVITLSILYEFESMDEDIGKYYRKVFDDQNGEYLVFKYNYTKQCFFGNE